MTISKSCPSCQSCLFCLLSVFSVFSVVKSINKSFRNLAIRINAAIT